MTRGMKGCYVYCTDKELSNYIKMRIHNSQTTYAEITENYLLAAETAEHEKLK